MRQIKKSIFQTSQSQGECPMTLGNDSGTYSAGGTKTIFVLDNDGVITNPVITITTPPVNGSAVVNVNNSITYTNVSGSSDSLVYQVSNGECTATATVFYFLASAPPAYYVLHLSNSTSISSCAGSGVSTYPLTVSVATNPINVGDTVYVGEGTTTIFSGDNTWYSKSSTYSLRINNLGIITEISDCQLFVPE